MSTAVTTPFLLVPPYRRLFLRLSLGVIVLISLLGISRSLGRDVGGPVEIFILLFAVAQSAIALATCHKEILAASFTFTQPGLRSRISRTQVTWALTVGLLAAVAAFLLKIGASGMRPVAMVFGAAVVVYAVFALLTFQLAWSFQLPAWMFYGFFLIPLLTRAETTHDLAAVIAYPWPWLGAAALLLFVLGWWTRSVSLHRRLCGSMVLAPEDILRPGRMQTFKETRVAYRRSEQDMAWRSALLDRCLARAAAAADRGRHAHARAWLLMHGSMSQTFTRIRWILPLVILAALAMAVCGGYYDSRVRDGDMIGWFAGLVFSWAIFPLTGVCMAMNNLGITPRGRRLGVRSELLALGWSAALTAAVGLFIMGVFALLAQVLPDVNVFGRYYYFMMPRPHMLLIPALVAPAMWLAVAIRPRPYSPVPAMATFQVFLFGHALMTFFPYRVSMPIWIGLMVLAGVGAFVLRRRWWARGDQSV